MPSAMRAAQAQPFCCIQRAKLLLISLLLMISLIIGYSPSPLSTSSAGGLAFHTLPNYAPLVPPLNHAQFHKDNSAMSPHRQRSRGESHLMWGDSSPNYEIHSGTGMETSSSADGPCLIFPGGGLFFYWQAGVISYLQENGYHLSSPKTLLSGASAGALAATLAATEVDFYDATELALSMSETAGVWDRPLGLQGIWGGIIYEWLDHLLPLNANEIVDQKLHLLVTPVPSFGKTRISNFESREDLIQSNMASVHIPWFLDGNLTYELRGQPHIDGSFLAKKSDYFSTKYSKRPQIILDFKRDPVMRDRAAEFLKVVSKQTIWDILEQGKKHAQIMDMRGEFGPLTRQ